METMNAHFRVVMNEGEVSKVLKELLSIRVSSLNKCRTDWRLIPPWQGGWRDRA